MNMFEKLVMYFEYPFVRYALIVGFLIALISSLLGIVLVLKRFSFISDGLSHTAFGAMAVAGIVGLTNNLFVTMPITIICAILLLNKKSNSKINPDAAVCVLSVGALGVGYLLLNLFSASGNLAGDVCGTLFGSVSILTLSEVEVIVCLVLSIIILALFVLFYNKIFAITFDENFSKATGNRTKLFSICFSIIIAVVIVLAMNLVGSLLISALIIFPCLSTSRVFKSFKGVTISSAIVSSLSAVLGIIISILAETPVGSTIVAVDLVVFIIFIFVGFILRRAEK